MIIKYLKKMKLTLVYLLNSVVNVDKKCHPQIF